MGRRSRVGAALLLMFGWALAVPAGVGAAFGPLGEDLRVSFMGPDGNTTFFGGFAATAYNPAADEYLAVWIGDDNTAPLVNNEFEVFAQRLSSTGAPLGGRIRVSTQGADGVIASAVADPSVAYNPVTNEYLVAWSGEVGTSDEFEIWARRLSAGGVRLGGADDLRLSDMGPDNSVNYTATNPRVAANSTTGEYLVIWRGDDNTVPLVDEEFEVF